MAKDDNYDVGEKIGELKGTQAAMLGTLQNIQNELIRMASEQDKRHEQNVTLIAVRHGENSKLITDHKKDDDEHFKEVNEKIDEHVQKIGANVDKIKQLIWMIIYTSTGAAFIIGVIWAVYKELHK